VLSAAGDGGSSGKAPDGWDSDDDDSDDDDDMDGGRPSDSGTNAVRLASRKENKFSASNVKRAIRQSRRKAVRSTLSDPSRSDSGLGLPRWLRGYARNGVRREFFSGKFMQLMADATLPVLSDDDRFTAIDPHDLYGNPNRQVPSVRAAIQPKPALMLDARAGDAPPSSSSSSSSSSMNESTSSRTALDGRTEKAEPLGVLFLSFVGTCASKAQIADSAAARIWKLEDAHEDRSESGNATKRARIQSASAPRGNGQEVSSIHPPSNVR